MNCIFCKILKGEIASTVLYEDEKVLAIADIAPKAPTHILVFPREHIATLNELEEHPEGTLIVGHMVSVATKLAREKGQDQKGYRVVLNCNEDGGQSVFHIHAHLLAGRKLNWPPG